MAEKFGDELTKFSKSSLKKTEVTVTTPLGRQYNERIESEGVVSYVKDESGAESEFYVVDTKPDYAYANLKPFLFLGSQDISADLGFMKNLGVTHIMI